jgi:hypothetical protein
MAEAFEKGLSSAKVVWIPHAAHYVFRSHEAGVIREMNTFIAGLLLTNRGEMTGMSEHPTSPQGPAFSGNSGPAIRRRLKTRDLNVD